MRLNPNPSARLVRSLILPVRGRLLRFACLLAILSDGSLATAQQPAPGAAPPQTGVGNPEHFRRRVETDLVVLHATVTDRSSRPIADLKQEHFRVFEDNIEQKIKVFKR